MRNRWTHILWIIMCYCSIATAQEMTLFSMQNLPQTQFVNPAVQTQYDWIVGIPGLASTAVNYNNTMFSFDEVLTRNSTDDSYYLDMDKLVDNFEGIGLAQANVNYTPIFVGFRHKKDFFTFSITEKLNTYNTIPQSALELAWYGNLNETASIASLRTNGYHLREYAFGISRKVSKQWTLGAHLKLLFGKGSFYMPRTNGYISTDHRNFDLYLEATTQLKTSLPIDISTDENGRVTGASLKSDFDPISYMTNSKNKGLGIDLGFTYEVNPEITIYGSLLNLGFVNWKSDTNILSIDEEVGYTTSDDILTELDSTINTLIPYVSQETYPSQLVPEIYLGGSYKVTEHLQAGLYTYARLMSNRIHPAFSASVQTHDYNRLSASLSYNIIDGDYSNIGAGIGYQVGFVHLHASADNLLGFTNIVNQRQLNLRFGLSITPRQDKTNIKSRTCNCPGRWEGGKSKYHH